MSVIIKGMKMPEKCPDCNFESELGFCLAKSPDFCGYTDDIRRPDWCPLVELPEHHGDLIDRDALSFIERLRFIKELETQLYGGVSWSFAWCTSAINNAPAIIEAEGEKE